LANNTSAKVTQNAPGCCPKHPVINPHRAGKSLRILSLMLVHSIE